MDASIAEPVILPAHAKINLVLELLGPRADGYTELETVYQQLELADTVELRCREEGVELEDDGAVGVPAEENLAVRAARAWLRTAGERAGLSIRLTKRIPARAGLGGGSADAAAVLAGLERLYGPRLGPAELAELAGRLGADVPFFLVGGTAVGRGRGEILEPLEGLRSWEVVLAREGEGLATREVFAGARRSLTPRRRAPTIQRFGKYLEGGQKGPPPLLNELEPAAVELAPVIRELIRDLEAFGAASAMTGSGSAVFGLFEGVAEADRAAEGLAERWPHAWTHRTRTRDRGEIPGRLGGRP